MSPLDFLSHSEDETLSWASAFAGRLSAGDTVAIRGPLGAGKTVLCRGLAQGLGYHGDVHSPSYALVHEYLGGRLPVYHMDLYRLAPGASAVFNVAASPDASSDVAINPGAGLSNPGSTGSPMDWEEIGLDHYFNQGGICLVEWAERLPTGTDFTWRIDITAEGETQRRIRAEGSRLPQ